MTTRVTIRNMKHAFSATAGETELEVHSGSDKTIVPPGEEREFFVEGEEGIKVKEKKAKPDKEEPEVEPLKEAAASKKPLSPDPYPSSRSAR